MEKPASKVFISWAKMMQRTKGIAAELGARDFYIERLKGSSSFLLPLRYALQARETLSVLRRERPRVILASNPPIFLPLLAYLAARKLKAAFVIDSHTAAFDGKWAPFLPLHRFLSRRAAATIVTNEPLRARVASWGAPALILEDRVPDLPVKAAPKNKHFSVVMVSSFATNEPLDAVLAAAANLPEYRIFVTGRAPAHMANLVATAPGNVTFTGFVPWSDYVALLNRADAVMVLVKRDLTLLCGAYEAVAIEKPLITSDWPVLRNYFNQGALYVDNSPQAIHEAVIEAARSGDKLRDEIRLLKRTLRQSWSERFVALCARIAEASGGEELTSSPKNSGGPSRTKPPLGKSNSMLGAA